MGHEIKSSEVAQPVKRELLVLATSFLIGACAPFRKKAPMIYRPTDAPDIDVDGSYSLQRLGRNKVFDPHLPDDDSLDVVEFYYEPSYSGGALVLETHWKNRGGFRIVSLRVEDFEKTVVFDAKPFLHKAGNILKYPDDYWSLNTTTEVYLGWGAEGERGEDMRNYSLVRTADGLQGKYLGQVSVSPEPMSIGTIITPK